VNWCYCKQPAYLKNNSLFNSAFWNLKIITWKNTWPPAVNNKTRWSWWYIGIYLNHTERNSLQIMQHQIQGLPNGEFCAKSTKSSAYFPSYSPRENNHYFSISLRQNLKHCIQNLPVHHRLNIRMKPFCCAVESK